MHLMAASTWTSLADTLRVILMVAGGLGFVIFVHELGHFVVAKLCGVKCEKFYLGFDIAGLKLFKFQWGETEYGIGILPLGGYVKMLGQDDNPAGEAADIERAQHEPLDPRSYKAQSVPERMAIISAGVIMNLIFAVIFAAIAYHIGVRDLPCVISGTVPGEAAWQADMRPGDQVIQINDQPSSEKLRFRDLQQAVVFSNPEEGVRFKVRREGVAESFWITVKPETNEDRLAPMIGANSPFVPTLRPEPALPGTSAGKAGFKSADKIVAVAGEPVENYGDLVRHFAHHADDTVSVGVERQVLDKDDKPTGKTENVAVELAANPFKTLGLQMKMGPITAIQEHSAAVKAGLKRGDQIVSIDGEPVGDPITLPARMQQKAGQALELTIDRPSEAGKLERMALSITPRVPDWWEESQFPTSPLAVTALGIAYRVPTQIEAIEPGSPAETAELVGGGNATGGKATDAAKGSSRLAPGMEVKLVEFVPPPRDSKEPAADEAQPEKGKPIKFGKDGISWPCFHQLLQGLKPGTKVKLTLSDERTVELEPIAAEHWSNPDRGFLYEPEKITVKADSWAQAGEMGVRETRDGATQVYGFLRRLGTRISPMGLGGPITIAKEAGHHAKKGTADLLLFLTMLSANLAVINFLPIPVLDGGHMMFLVLESILRRPVNERVQLAFTYVGVIFILGLMVFVVGLDVGRLFSWI
jgi:regulator of sigma E protease